MARRHIGAAPAPNHDRNKKTAAFLGRRPLCAAVDRTLGPAVPIPCRAAEWRSQRWWR